MGGGGGCMLCVGDIEECGVGISVKKVVVYYEVTKRNAVPKKQRHTNLQSVVLAIALYSN
jgi:hypothetical protein